MWNWYFPLKAEKTLILIKTMWKWLKAQEEGSKCWSTLLHMSKYKTSLVKAANRTSSLTLVLFITYRSCEQKHVFYCCVSESFSSSSSVFPSSLETQSKLSGLTGRLINYEFLHRSHFTDTPSTAAVFSQLVKLSSRCVDGFSWAMGDCWRRNRTSHTDCLSC